MKRPGECRELTFMDCCNFCYLSRFKVANSVTCCAILFYVLFRIKEELAILYCKLADDIIFKAIGSWCRLMLKCTFKK
jgi:hypothetical protein